ncbi:hypothetical protein DFH08DRAFT_811082 [Mycena albidolilacea]|uniref:Uncharacterized protein n=1 Tax=Mycena albidolilacea TaxID=1033008 RepID=A0AAD6ZW12_9AGAR|nr:hypothetical protein DFH08DRAFT_811082 [Mycena albidolilacea]
MPSGPFLDSWNLGASLSLFLQGVLCAQFAHYTSLNKRDSMWIKLFVAGLGFLTTLKTLHSLAMMWTQNLSTFGNLKAGSSPRRSYWLSEITVILEAITIFYVQMFLCRRLWALFSVLLRYATSNCTALAPNPATTDLLLFHCDQVDEGLDGSTSGNYVVRRPFSDRKHNILLASTLSYMRPIPQPSHNHPQISTSGNTAGKWNLHLDDTSATPAALCALINFAGDMRPPTTPAPRLALLTILTNIVLPYLYAWSAMWTLNSREDICLEAANCPYTFNFGLSVGASNSETTQGQHPDILEPVAKVERAPLDDAPESMA